MESKKSQTLAGYVLIFILLLLIVVAYILFKPEQIIGGCGAVHPRYIQKCCDNWAEENNIVHVACVGQWEVEEGKCKWVCSVD